MFLLECPHCGRRELRSVHALSSLANTDHGIELAMSCNGCGASVHTLTGARAAATEVRATPVATVDPVGQVTAPAASTAA